jgi:hypothetical protein
MESINQDFNGLVALGEGASLPILKVGFGA